MPILHNGTPKVDDTIARKRAEAKMQSASTRWWIESDEQMMLNKLWAVRDQIHNNMSARRRQNYLYALMYNDVDTNLYASQAGTTIAHNSSADSASQNKITLNVIQNCVDTSASIIATDRPIPRFIADTGDYKDDLKAQMLTTYVQAVIDDMKLHELMERGFTDSAIYGTGCIKLYADFEEKKIKADWVWLSEVLVDDLDGSHEKPRQMHQSKFVSRDELCELYPEKKDKIMDVSNELKGVVSMKTQVDEVLVTESWHLRSGKKAKDGKHIISIRNAILFEEEYKKDYFPLQFFRFYHQTVGFWGRGICQSIGKIQRVINKLARVIDLAQELIGVPVIISPKEAMIAEDHIMNNEIGHWIEYFGGKGPEFLSPPAVQAELYQHLWALEERAYNYVGINQQMAQGEKDKGVKSAPAIREATDVAAGRLQRVAQRYEQWMIDMADVIVDLSKDLYEENEDLSVIAEDKNGIVKVFWRDVDMDRDRFKIKCYPVSALPKTPQGRMDMVAEWGAQGWIPKPIQMSLVGIDPALQEFAGLETASFDLVRSTIAEIKQSEEYPLKLKPIGEQDLQLAINIARQEKVLAKKQGVPDHVLDLIDVYIQDCNYLIQQQMPQAPAPMTAPMPPAPGPMPGPQMAPPPGPQMPMPPPNGALPS